MLVKIYYSTDELVVDGLEIGGFFLLEVVVAYVA